MRVKLQAWATVVFVVGVLLGIACKLWFPQYWFDAYPVVLVVYWVMEMVQSFVLERYGRDKSDTSVPSRMFVKVLFVSKLVKMIITIVLIAVYLLCYQEHTVPFVVSAVLFYFLNLVAETYVVTKRPKT